MEKFAECVQDSEQLKSALLEMQVQNFFFNLGELTKQITQRRHAR